MKKGFVFLFSFLCIIGISNVCWAIEYKGVEFPDGAASFADAVISYTNTAGVSDLYDDPSEALGIPDYTEGDGVDYVSLGHGGELILQFTDNSLTTSGTTAEDLWIFEIGGAVENMDVYIGTNTSNWIFLGQVLGQPTGINIDAIAGVTMGTQYSFVRIVDGGDPYSSGSPWEGADIDAVGAISSAPPVPVPEPGISLLLGFGLLNLYVLRRKLRQ